MSREDFQNLLVLAQAVPFFDISASFEPNLRAPRLFRFSAKVQPFLCLVNYLEILKNNSDLGHGFGLKHLKYESRFLPHI